VSARRLISFLAAALGAASLATAATANAAVEWRDAGVEVPENVDLHAVATSGATVVAVGTDTTTDEAVVYRRAEGEWQRDLPLPPPPPFVPEPVIDPETGEPVVDPETGEPVMTEPPPPPPKTFGDLVDVAIGGGSAWAIGSAPAEGGGERPLILRLTAEGWTEVDAPASMGLPRALALEGDDGLVGDAAGQVFALTDGAFASAPLTRGGVVAPPVTPVNGVALSGAGEAFAVAQPKDSFSGFLAVDRAKGEMRQDVAETIPAGMQPVAIGVAGTLALAVDGNGPCRDTAPGGAPGLWTRDASLDVWRREVPTASATGTRWCDLALSGTTLVLAGDRATASGRVGAIWRREGAGTLRLEDDFDHRPLHGVAVGPTEAWAVGEGGALWRRADWPPPPPDDDDDGDGDGDGDGGDNTTDTGNDGGGDQAQPTPEQPTDPPPAPETIVAPLGPTGDGPVEPTTTTKPKPKTKPRQDAGKAAQRLLVGLKARRTGRRLVLSFRLKARARVFVTALRGTRVVARVRSRALKPGARRLVVRFRGQRPPTQLKIVVSPVGGPGVNKEGKGS
jgi:hypothetical protein